MQQWAQKVKESIFVIVVGVALGFLANLILRMRNGLHQIPSVSAWETLAAISAIPASLIVTTLKLEMAWVVVAATITPLVVKLFSSIIFLARNTEFLPRKVADANGRLCRSLMAGGSVFFVATLANAVAVQSDQISDSEFGPGRRRNYIFDFAKTIRSALGFCQLRGCCPVAVLLRGGEAGKLQLDKSNVQKNDIGSHFI